MSKRRRNMSIISLTAALSILGAACSTGTGDSPGSEFSGGGSNDQENSGELFEITYTAGSGSMALLPIEVMISSGIAEEYGLKINLGPYTGQQVQALESGDVQVVGTGTPSTLDAIAAGRDIQAVGVVTPAPTTELVLGNTIISKLEDSGLTPESAFEDRVTALKGSTIVTAVSGQSTNQMFRLMLEEAGLDPDKDLEIITNQDTSAMVNLLRSGRVDGIAYSPPVTTQTIVDGYGQHWLNIHESEVTAGANFTWAVMTKDFISENPEVVESFTQALLDSFSLLKEGLSSELLDKVKDDWFDELDDQAFEAAFEWYSEVFQKGPVPNSRDFDGLVEIIAESSVNDGIDELVLEDVFYLDAFKALGVSSFSD